MVVRAFFTFLFVLFAFADLARGEPLLISFEYEDKWAGPFENGIATVIRDGYFILKKRHGDYNRVNMLWRRNYANRN